MGYRNDTEAAHARAAALERELAEKEADLKANADALDATKAELADTRAELDEQRDNAVARDTAEEAKAKRKLDALRERKPKRKSNKKQATPAARLPDHKDARMLRSLSGLAETEWWMYCAFLFIPGIAATTQLVFKFGKPFALIGFAGIAAAGYGASKLGQRWVRSRVAAEQRWADSFEFEVGGYPELLGEKPQHSPNALSHHTRGHTTLQVKLHFVDKPPTDLEEIMLGFDDKLRRTKPRTFCRDSPLTIYVTRRGSHSKRDDNRQVRKWVRKLAAKVLRPLHKVHPIAQVEVMLS